MIRILDLDLDFFLDGVGELIPKDGPRLDPSEYRPWSISDAFAFLESACLLEGRSAGWSVEHHDELFPLWRKSIEEERLEEPFHVTHVDAHADLGMGDSAYMYVMGELLFDPVEGRRYPRTGDGAMDFGNWLLFALANRWIADLTYVFNEVGGSDVFSWHMENFDNSASNLQLKAARPADLKASLGTGRIPPIQATEPLVPFAQVPWVDFHASEPYDIVCLTRSPSYTPETSDRLFDAIRQQFIDESILG